MTKTEVFAAYVPYIKNIEYTDSTRVTGIATLDNVASAAYYAFNNINKVRLLLHPLSRLTQKIKHQVTGEEVVPIEYIGNALYKWTRELKHIPTQGGTGTVEDIYINHRNGHYPEVVRFCDNLALSLHLDIFGAIEKGWAKEMGV